MVLRERRRDNQTCTNTYDDLARISGNTCGSTWAQTFGYDAFGNISKSGSISWGCLSCYTYSTNRYNTVPNQITYDANGNLLADSFNTYTWDVYGDLASANGNAITYDAFGRMVENSNGGNQFAYGPSGIHPLASMQGQNLLGAFVPLPGGAVALYNSGGLAQYNHADWLGSARLFSNPSRVAIPAMSYAPFGEGYAGGQGYVQFTNTGNAFTVYDTENQSGSLTDFTFRRYAPVQGRWIAPDPAGLAAVDPTNPQSWNRYAYVANNPLSYVDPLGLKYVLICTPVADGGQVCDWYDDGSGDGTPPPNQGGRSGGGGVNNGTNCTPLTKGCSNVPTAGQQCISNFYNSKLGTAAAFGSPLALLPGWNPQWGSTMQEWGIAIFGKVGGLFGSGAMSGTTQLTTLSGTTTVGSALELGTEGVLGAAETAATPAMVAATALDIGGHAYCSTMSGGALVTPSAGMYGAIP